jgi:hypothetical protein
MISLEDEELLKIWEEKENSVIKCNRFNNLPIESKIRIFDLIMENKHIKMKGGKKNG